MKKHIQIKNKQLFIFICAILFLLISLLPILALGSFNVPGSDDYSYGALTHQAWKQSRSLINVLFSAFKQTFDFYYRWQGTFGSCFLMSLNPGIINPNMSFLVPIIMLTLCISSTLLLFHEIYHVYLRCPSIPSLTVLLIFLSSFFQVMVSAKDGLYWYNGSIHYMGIQALSFYLIFFLSLLLRTSSRLKQVFLSVPIFFLSFFLGGGNLVTALQICIIYVFTLFYSFWSKKRVGIRLILPFCFFLIGFVINIIAPGNTVRGNVFSGLSPLQAIIASFLSAANYAIEWMNLIIILTFIIIFPLIWKMIRQSDFSFPRPSLVLCVSICIYAAMFTPSLYATGSLGADRQLNIIQLSYYLLQLLNVCYYIGYLQRNKSDSSFVLSVDNIIKNYSGKIFLLAFVSLCFVFLFTSDRTTYTSIAATRLLINGEARQYKTEYLQRMEILEDDSISIAFVTPYSVHPDLLAMDDEFSSDSENWLNIEGSKYFNKTAIILQETP